MKKKCFLALLMAGMISFALPVSASAEWKQDDSKNWSWVENGTAQTGWKSIGNKWYYFDENGIMKTGWIWDGSNWYYMNASGSMMTGWLKDGGKWYYLKPSGAMAKEWLEIGGKWYYLNEDGSMAEKCTIDGFSIDANGVADLSVWTPIVGVNYNYWSYEGGTVTTDINFWNNSDKPINRVEFYFNALDKEGNILTYKAEDGSETDLFGNAGTADAIYPMMVQELDSKVNVKFNGEPKCLALHYIRAFYTDGTQETTISPYYFYHENYNGPASYDIFAGYPDFDLVETVN